MPASSVRFPCFRCVEENLRVAQEVTGLVRINKALGVYCVVFEPPSGMTQDALLKALAKDDLGATGAARYTSLPFIRRPRTRTSTTTLTSISSAAFVETDAALAHNLSQGSGVHIAIVDTGVDMTHLDLQGRLRDVHNVVDDDAAAFNHDSHGTEVAGVIAAP